jgi:hypothetical protein
MCLLYSKGFEPVDLQSLYIQPQEVEASPFHKGSSLYSSLPVTLQTPCKHNL